MSTVHTKTIIKLEDVLTFTHSKLIEFKVTYGNYLSNLNIKTPQQNQSSHIKEKSTERNIYIYSKVLLSDLHTPHRCDSISYKNSSLFVILCINKQKRKLVYDILMIKIVSRIVNLFSCL